MQAILHVSNTATRNSRLKLLPLSWTAKFCLHQPLKVLSWVHLSAGKTFIERNYPCVMPVYLQSGHTSMYVPILSVIQELFKNTDTVNKITEPNAASGQYASCSDGSHFLENYLLSSYHSSYILMILKLQILLAHHAKFTNFALYIGFSLMCFQNTDQHYMLYSLDHW